MARYCGMCEKVVAKKECPLCGADTDPIDRDTAATLGLEECHRKALQNPPKYEIRKALREATLRVGR